MKNTLCVIVVMLLFVGACNKGNNELEFPGPSQSGENYVACKINGEPYVFKGNPVGLDPTGVAYYYGLWSNPTRPRTRDVSIRGSDVKGQRAQVYFNLSNDSAYYVPLNLKINIEERLYKQQIYVMLEDGSYVDKYYYARPGSGWIQFSRADSIGAGTFAFTAYSSTDSVVVTDGRFDIRQ